MTLRQREPRVRDPKHMAKISRLPCLACLIKRGAKRYGVHVAHVRASYIEAEGWREVGKAEKPSDTRTIPLCPGHHMDYPDAQHRSNEKQWYADLGVYPPNLCAALVEAFAAGATGESVLMRFADKARAEIAQRDT